MLVYCNRWTNYYNKSKSVLDHYKLRLHYLLNFYILFKLNQFYWSYCDLKCEIKYIYWSIFFFSDSNYSAYSTTFYIQLRNFKTTPS